VDRDTIWLRPALPTLDEGMVCARFLNGLTPGFRITFGRRHLEILAGAYVQPGHDLSFEHATFAERDGVIVGLVAGYTAEEHRTSSREPLRAAAGRGLHGRIGAALSAAFMRHLGPGADDEYYVWALAVGADERRQGIGSLLMDHAEETARERGCSLLSLDVEAKNEGARRFYESRGMSIQSKWPPSRLLPAGTYRMAKRVLNAGIES
jgi:ribosomal protein S18 acetylase RimI-like enzyme